MKRHRAGLAFLILAIPAVTFSCGDRTVDPGEGVVRVAAAASLTDLLTEVAHRFEAESGSRCRLNFASSSVLARQIEEGLGCEVFLSATPSWVEYLERKGLLLPGSRRDLLGNALVIVVPVGSTFSIRSLADLAGDDVVKIAAGDPSHVPAGGYAREALEKAALWESVSPKIVGAVDVRGALEFVKKGAVDCGIVYATDAKNVDEVRVVHTVPADRSPKIVYTVGRIGAESAGSGPAGAFVDFLFTATAKEIYRKHGFLTKWD